MGTETCKHLSPLNVYTWSKKVFISVYIEFLLIPSFDGHFIKIPVRLGALTP